MYGNYGNIRREKLNYHLKKYIILTLGLSIYSLGIALMIKTDLGLSSWDAFYQGFSRITGVTFGQASIIAGALIIITDIFLLNQPIGTGSIIDLVGVGLFIDLFSLLLPSFAEFSLTGRILLFIVGLTLCGYGCYVYIPKGLGCGPIDSLLVGMTQKTNKPLGMVSISLEAFALLTGYLMGGSIGVGTVLATFLKGPILHGFFKLNKVDIHSIKHKNLKEELIILKNAFRQKI